MVASSLAFDSGAIRELRSPPTKAIDAPEKANARAKTIPWPSRVDFH
jgi:hypothetical protein